MATINVQSFAQRFDGFGFDEPAPGVLRLTFDAPGINAVDARHHRQLGQVWAAFDVDDDVRVVLLRGAGKGFSAGGNFELLQEMVDDFAVRQRVMDEGRDLVRGILGCSKPIVSAIHGPAVGAGLVAALMADVSIAAESAKLVDGHTRLGVAAGDHASLVWPMLCGMAKAKYYLLLCDALSGVEAERIGLVSLCVPADELESTALDVSIRLADGPRTAIAATKRALNLWFEEHLSIFEASLGLEMFGFGGPEVREGLAAHLEKRPPRFR